MKKYVILAVCTVLAVGTLLALGAWNSTPENAVTLYTLQAQTATKTVQCTGKVEAANSTDVFFEIPCVAGEVFVKAGQTVKQGDALFSIDKTATQSVFAGFSSALGALDGVSETVTATVSGKVKEINVKEGEMTDPNKPCAVIAPSDEVQITVAVREKHLPQIAPGQRVLVSGVGFEKDQYRGTLVSLADTARQQYIGTVSETVVDAVIQLDDGEWDKSLRVGLGATALVATGEIENALLVPYDCITQDENQKEYVYVYTDEGIAVRRDFTAALSSDDGVLVVSGLAAGERLVRDADRFTESTVSVQVAA